MGNGISDLPEDQQKKYKKPPKPPKTPPPPLLKLWQLELCPCQWYDATNHTCSDGTLHPVYGVPYNNMLWYTGPNRIQSWPDWIYVMDVTTPPLQSIPAQSPTYNLNLGETMCATTQWNSYTPITPSPQNPLGGCNFLGGLYNHNYSALIHEGFYRAGWPIHHNNPNPLTITQSRNIINAFLIEPYVGMEVNVYSAHHGYQFGFGNQYQQHCGCNVPDTVTPVTTPNGTFTHTKVDYLARPERVDPWIGQTGSPPYSGAYQTLIVFTKGPQWSNTNQNWLALLSMGVCDINASCPSTIPCNDPLNNFNMMPYAYKNSWWHDPNDPNMVYANQITLPGPWDLPTQNQPPNPPPWGPSILPGTPIDSSYQSTQTNSLNMLIQGPTPTASLGPWVDTNVVPSVTHPSRVRMENPTANIDYENQSSICEWCADWLDPQNPFAGVPGHFDARVLNWPLWIQNPSWTVAEAEDMCRCCPGTDPGPSGHALPPQNGAVIAEWTGYL